ncbi:hypothetical protein GCM10009425_45190 [Pseudomonas asuensis]|uniref:DUF1203 domain-containing protein n=1 Tax=Pseudomonas asuensis TaxID=1825787 RepID=A0ABQ2H3T4_9PSED|nr:DUF1203 domain-containing protein [Pseudomonas asuensis]GGM29583.1 hypothetical protein GCM10009425_45190 [Pseudomonas asuensis]
MSFRITGLDPAPFKPLFGLSEAELSNARAMRYIADQTPGFPDRVSLKDVEPGQAVLLLNFMHQPAQTPYQASHAIFIREGMTQRHDQIDAVPESLRLRLLSVRGFDNKGLMIDADVVEGPQLESLIRKLFSNPVIDYLHIHYAKRGCYAARVDKV